MGAPAVKIKTMKFHLVIFMALIVFAPTVCAFWRMECHGSLGVARIDPIVSPGEASLHAHTSHGAQSFSFDSNFTSIRAANCTSCSVDQDRSLYWTPAMYFQHENGTFELVPQIGGMLAYYFNDNVDPAGVNLTAFPQGFRMVAGDMRRRNFTMCDPDKPMSDWVDEDMTQECLAAKSTGFNCLHYYNGELVEGSMEYHYMRNKTFLDANCPQGLRLELQFPSCWDGIHNDSPDHKSHILYPNLMKTGTCPPGFEIRTPVLFYETIWYTYQFANYSGQYVMSYGDTTGYGYHGDFMSGWNQTVLQDAVSTCTNGSGNQEDCGVFTIQEDSIATSCKLDVPEALLNENVVGPIPCLPGDVAIQSGPSYATMPWMGGNTGSNTTSATSMVPGLHMNSTVHATGSSDQLLSSAMTDMAPSQLTIPQPVMPPSPTEDLTYTTTTSSFISDGVAVVMVIVEEILTVTVTETSTKSAMNAKRHAHKHGRGGLRNGF